MGAAAEIPPVFLFAIGFLALIMCLVAYGLHGAWERTLGALFGAIGGVSVLGAHPLGFVKDASNAVANAFLSIAKRSGQASGYLFHVAAELQGRVAKELYHLAEDVYGWATWLQRSHLPKWVKALVYALLPPLVLPAVIHALKHAKYGHIITRLRTITHTIEHTVVHVVTRVAHAGVALPGWAWRLPGRVGRLEHDRANIWRRLRSLEKYVGATGAVALFVAALAKLGLRWLRCRNVSKVGRQVCSMDSRLLDELLTDGLLIVGAISVVEFAKTLLAIEGEAVRILGAGIREFPSS